MITLFEMLGYQFADLEHVELALTHRSYDNEYQNGRGRHNERLEFLGDAVLELVLTESLMKLLPLHREGDLSKARASLVNEAVLCEIAQEIELASHLKLGKGEFQTGGFEKPSILSSTLEAAIGAVFLDGGYEASRQVVLKLYRQRLEDLDLSVQFTADYKSRFQEMAQAAHRTTPVYRHVSSEGPDHEKTFRAEVWLGDRCVGQGEGKSKKAAEQEAAKAAMKEMK